VERPLSSPRIFFFRAATADTMKGLAVGAVGVILTAMKMRVFSFFAAAVIALSWAAADEGNFKSIILGGGASKTIDVPGNRYIIVRNFTQQDGTDRGVITVNTTDGTADILAATLVDTDPASTLEPVNNVYVVGPANVTVTCGAGATSCYFTFVKFDKN
jgi:hypothetical protein